MTSPQKILVIKPSAIGDVVHTLPILNLLRKRWPAAHIAWLITPACAGMIQGHPQLDEVILFDRKKLGSMWKNPRVFFELRRFTRSLAAKQFDLVLDLQGLFRSGWLARKTHAPMRVGFRNARELAWFFYTHRVPIGTMEQHAIERYLTLARSIGCEGEVEFVFAHDDEDRRAVRAMIDDAIGMRGVQSSPAASMPLGVSSSSLHIAAPRYAILAPTTNWDTKRWPAGKFAGLVAPLRDRFGLESILIGGPDVAAMSSQFPGAINIGGKTTLRQLCALIESAALVISNDSGPMHIAAAMRRPLVTMFGPTNPVRTGPYGRMQSVIRLPIACSPCYLKTCWHQSCLKHLEIGPVLELAERQMNGS